MSAIDKLTDEELYLEFVNDFLTIEGMADYYLVEVGALLIRLRQGKDDFILSTIPQED